MRSRAWLASMGALWLVALAPSASAHTRSTSYSRWTIEPHGATVALELSLLDSDALARDLGDSRSDPWVSDAAWRHALTSDLALTSAGRPCQLVEGSFTRRAARKGFVAYEWQLHCPAPMTHVRVRSDLLFELLPDHVHFVHVEGVAGVSDTLVTHERREVALALDGSDSHASTLWRYARLGAEHILSGWDHLLFVLALLFTIRRVRQVAVVVTGFTIGHSVTLGLAATGHASADPASVEALIGLSIALLAVDGAWLACARDSFVIPATTVLALLGCALLAVFRGPVSALALFGLAMFAACYLPLLAQAREPARLRGAVAALFGLIHGFGFASALMPLHALGSTPLVPLLGFNLGVEIGQFAVVGLAWPALLVARRYLGEIRVTVHGTATLLCLGVALFASRAG